MTRTLLLDLDGTLVDSVPDLMAALNRLMQARELADFTQPEVASMVGDGTKALVDRAFAARAQAGELADLAEFMADYTANAAQQTRAYPGVLEVLAGLRAEGWRLAVCTNKPEAPARTILDALGLAPLMAAIGAGDSFPVRKPDPRHLLATLHAAGGTPGRAVMLGDHHHDIAAARGAGVGSIFAGWGYGTPARADGAPVAASFIEVPVLLARWAA